jgi:hypothetical protein
MKGESGRGIPMAVSVQARLNDFFPTWVEGAGVVVKY